MLIFIGIFRRKEKKASGGSEYSGHQSKPLTVSGVEKTT
jgi:hypothetical protein